MEERINSGCAIIEHGKLLLLFRIKWQHYEFPGGRVELGESLEEAALRETKEEIGCDVEIIKYLCAKEINIDNKYIISHKFLAKIKPGQTPRITEPQRFTKIFWLPMKDYKKYPVAPNVKGFCEDFIQGKLNLK